MTIRFPESSRVLAIAMLATAVLASNATAGSFAAYPALVELSGQVPSMVVTIENKGDEAARFQVSVAAWQQSTDGQPAFAATDEVVAFPPLLMLEPGAKRAIRLGLMTRPGVEEKAYRVFLEQLPPPPSSRPEAQQQVRVLTRLGIPVFVAPVQPANSQSMGLEAVSPGHLALVLRNEGNVHVHSRKVVISGLDAAGQRVLDRELPGGYILAGSPRTYAIELPAADCERISTFQVQLVTEGAPVTARLAALPNACSR